LLAIVLVSGVAMVLTETEQKKVKFHKLAAKAVIVLTSRQERRQMIQKQRLAMAARQQQLKKQRVMDMQFVSRNIQKPIQRMQPRRKMMNTDKAKRRMDGFL
jgi:hydroxymethylglutaryl-CoA reductase